MCTYNSIRNNFLGLIFLFVLMMPSLVFAKYDVKGDVNQNINNYSGGSSYSQERGGYNTATDEDPSKANLKLFNTVETKTELTPSELTGLKVKLEKGGSKVDLDSLTTDNVYTINTGRETIFVYDPKVDKNDPNNATDQQMLGLATADARMYIYKNPPLKESSEGEASLGYIDQDRGLEPGSTVANKNYLSNLKQNQKLAQEKIKETAAAWKQAGDELDAFKKSGVNDPVQKAVLEANLAKAEQDQRNANHKAYTNQEALTAAENKAKASAIPPPDDASCGFSITSPTAPFSFHCLLSMVSKFTNIGFKFVSFVAYVTGTLFDYSLELSMNSAEFFKKLGVIEITWSFIRDILNMTFIFILLWTAVQILIGNEAKYNAKKTLTSVILVAILINFSLFAAKLMVDGSNIVSLKIYEAMKSNSESADATISERIMNTVGLSTLYNVTEIFSTETIQAEGQCASNPGALITVSVMGSIFLIILSLALGLAAILFLIRLVNIIFLFIKSPFWVWGYVMPGSSTISKFKDEWWSQMRHVLIFPIVYLFWMLVAVIIFEKLGTVKTVSATGEARGGSSLIDLICNAPTSSTAGFGQSISLVAIFGIVIIFMMQAIKYGFANASGPQGSIGGDLSKKWAGKFAGYQTAMTKGLAQKSWNGTKAAGRMSVGAARGSLKFAGKQGGRVVGAGIGGAIGAIRKKDGSRWEGFKDGAAHGDITTKEALRDMARDVTTSAAAGGHNITAGLAARVASRYSDPKNSEDQTRKQLDAARSASTIASTERKSDAIEAATRVDTFKEWAKKHPLGTNDQYADYAEENMTRRIEGMYGKGIANLDGKGGQTHIQNLRKATLIRYKENQKDENGNDVIDPSDLTGKRIMQVDKIKFNENAMYEGLKEIRAHEKTAKSIKINKKRVTMFAGTKAQAEVDAIAAKEKIGEAKSRGKLSDENKSESLKKAIGSLEAKIKKLPDDTDILNSVNDYVPYSGKGDNEDTVKKLNTAVNDYTYGTPAEQSANQEKIDKALNAHKEHVSKQKAELVKKQSEYNKHQNSIEEKAKKEKEK